MIDRHWWTRQLPLENNRDVLARVGFRFLWATAPYFVFAYLLKIGPFADGGSSLQRFLAAFIFVIPILGGLLDSWRLRYRARHGGTTAA